MKKLSLVFLFIFAVSCGGSKTVKESHTDTGEIAFSKVIEFLGSKVQGEKVRIAADNITFEKSKMGTALSVYLESKLSTQIVNSNKFIEISRKDLERVLKEQELSQSDLFNQSKVAKIGELEGLQGIVSGEYIVAGEEIFLNLRLVSVRTNKTLAAAECRLDKNTLPKGLDLVPVNYKTMKENTVSIPSKGSLNIEVWTDRGDGGVYIDGEKLYAHFRANKDCYLRLFHVDVNGVKKLIFPNQFHRDNQLVKANQVYVFPSKEMNFDFVLGAPYGVEMIQAVASTTEFSDKIDAFSDLNEKPDTLFSRGLNVQSKATEIANARVFYTINKK